jgi:glycosyltransferase involved in cell wall biosynthesis
MSHRPLVAWAFNVGRAYGGIQQRLASRAMRRFSRIVVSSRREIEIYSDWLDLPFDRFVFSPFQRPAIPRVAIPDRTNPFVISIGSARRDYRTFCAAMAKLGYPGLIVAAPHALDGIHIPANVRVIPGGLDFDRCREFAQRALVNAIPLCDDQTPCGTVTVVEAMRMGCSIVATRCVGTEDYIVHGQSGFLVEPHDVNGMAGYIRQLWESEEDRMAVSACAARYAEENYSDEAAGRRLSGILTQVEQEWSDV